MSTLAVIAYPAQETAGQAAQGPGASVEGTWLKFVTPLLAALTVLCALLLAIAAAID